MLPNNLSFSPFAILTAEEMNDLVENTEALSDGTGIEDEAITTRTLAQSAVTPEKMDLDLAATDANGWTYIPWGKCWIKTVTFNTGSVGNNSYTTTASTVLPVGMSTLNSRPVSANAIGNGLNDSLHGFEFQPSASNNSSATSIRRTIKNISGGNATFQGQVTYIIYDTV